jgi:hypothetical protein
MLYLINTNKTSGMGRRAHSEHHTSERHPGALMGLSLPIFILILIDLPVDLGLLLIS